MQSSMTVYWNAHRSNFSSGEASRGGPSLRADAGCVGCYPVIRGYRARSAGAESRARGSAGGSSIVTAAYREMRWSQRLKALTSVRWAPTVSEPA
jgi:hypothetical protein